jgi:hypothetical protein
MENLGTTEAQFHEIIPDVSQAPRAAAGGKPEVPAPS